VATRYAVGPKNVSAFAWGDGGRLWLAAAGLGSHRADGVYTSDPASHRVTKVISGLNDPLGLLWIHATLYVASVGRVDAYGGFDGKRFARHRRILDGPVPGAENNALARAPDGRLLMGISATCDHCTPRLPASGAIVSFRPNGKDSKLYATGIRAPIGLAFVPGTSDLLATMNQRDDLGDRTPGDWLSFVPAGSAWGFPGCFGQAASACDGVPKPLVVLAKHAAAGAVAITRTGGSTDAYVAMWATASVDRITLTRTGSGYTARRERFLGGIEHPMALVSAPDGAILAGDWASGLVYRIARARPLR
jgi:glucose/arabinose dehydrogenase